MRRWILCAALVALAPACGDGKTTSGLPGTGDPGGGDAYTEGDAEQPGDQEGGDAPAALQLGDSCSPTDDLCATGLVCYDEGSGATCHTTCTASEWPASACDADTEACASAGDVGACVPALAAGATCDTADDLCGAAARCVQLPGDATPSCVVTCADNGDCESTEACFVAGFLTGGDETFRICAASLGRNDACDLDEIYCDAGLECVDRDGAEGDGGAVCELVCDPDGDWSECGGQACVPQDYFLGTLEAAGGICVSRIAGTSEPCEPLWDICGSIAAGVGGVCADLDGDGEFTCQPGVRPGGGHWLRWPGAELRAAQPGA